MGILRFARAAVMLAAVFTLAPNAHAQQCPRTCPRTQRDLRGCCLPVARGTIAVAVAPTHAGTPELATMQLFRAVPQYSSSQPPTAPRLRADLQMQTQTWDRTPTVMSEATTGFVTLSERHRISLAGNAEGSQGWSIDNFVLFEVYDPAGNLLSAAVVGGTEPVRLGGVLVPQLGPNGERFAPRQVDISSIFPVGRPFRLVATALDYGGVASLSDVFLMVD